MTVYPISSNVPWGEPLQDASGGQRSSAAVYVWKRESYGEFLDEASPWALETLEGDPKAVEQYSTMCSEFMEWLQPQLERFD